jgi:hypothetical protein
MEGFGMFTTAIGVPVHKTDLRALAEVIARINNADETDFYIEHCIYKDEKAQEYPPQAHEVIGNPQFWVIKSLYGGPIPDIHQLAEKCPNCDVYFVCGYTILRHIIRDGRVIQTLKPKYEWQYVETKV